MIIKNIIKINSNIVNMKNVTQKLKKNLEEAKGKPRSKRKSFFLGITTILGIFGVTLPAPVLPAVAKDVLEHIPNPTQVRPVPASTPNPALAPSKQIIQGLSGAAASICALALSSGSFIIGAACDVVVVIGLLKAQRK